MITEDDLKVLAGFDPDRINRLREVLNGTDTMSAAGAISLATYHTKLALDGTMPFTLGNGTTAGQRKRISCESGANTPVGTVTIATPDATAGYVCPAAPIFAVAGQQLDLLWTGAAWRITAVRRAGTFATTPDTTTMTGRVLYQLYTMAISGTIEGGAAGVTKKFPDGLLVGDVCQIGVASAASTPHGSWDGAFATVAGVAGSSGTGGAGKLGDFAAVTTNALLTWNGTTWVVSASIGGVVAS